MSWFKLAITCTLLPFVTLSASTVEHALLAVTMMSPNFSYTSNLLDETTPTTYTTWQFHYNNALHFANSSSRFHAVWYRVQKIRCHCLPLVICQKVNPSPFSRSPPRCLSVSSFYTYSVRVVFQDVAMKQASPCISTCTRKIGKGAVATR